MSVAHQERIMVRHLTDTASKQVNTSIVLRHHAWLRSATISGDARVQIEDLPFDSLGLFDTKTENILKNLQKMRKTARSYSSQNSYYHPRQPWCRYYTYQPYIPNADKQRAVTTPATYQPGQQPACQCFRQPIRRPDKKHRVFDSHRPLSTFLPPLRTSLSHNWQNGCHRLWVLIIVSTGYKIEFESLPPTPGPCHGHIYISHSAGGRMP